MIRCTLCRRSFVSLALYHRHLMVAHCIPPSIPGQLMLARNQSAMGHYEPDRTAMGPLQSQQAVQAPTTSIQTTGSYIVTTTTFSNGVRIRSSSATNDDNNPPFRKIDSPDQNIRANPAHKECPVCYVECDVSGHVFYPCSHSLCQDCFNKWNDLPQVNRCPVCRQPYKPLDTPQDVNSRLATTHLDILNIDIRTYNFGDIDMGAYDFDPNEQFL